MNCEEVYRDFSDYIDGNLTEAKTEKIAEHIAHCEKCHTYHRLITEGTRAYRLTPEITLPDDFYGRLEHSIFELEEEKRIKRAPFRMRSIARRFSPVVSTSAAFAIFLYFMSTRIPVSREAAHMPQAVSPTVSEAMSVPSAPVAMPPARDDAFALARFLEQWGDTRGDGPFTTLTGALENVPVSVSDPAYATFVSEDPSYSFHQSRSVFANPLVQTTVGFAAIPARMERPLSRITRSQDGLLVVDVQFMSKAFVAGLRKGDVIVALDEKPLDEATNLIQVISERRNAPTEVRVVRNGKLVDLKLE
jgi:hypothetical protein